jgi:hypothetical protein
MAASSASSSSSQDVEAGGHVNTPLIATQSGQTKTVSSEEANEWRKQMWPVWLAGILLLVVEYTYCTIFVANIHYLWVGVLVASVLWVTVLILCLCCVVPRQKPEHKWLGKAIVGTVMGVMGIALIGGLVGATYLEEYRETASGTTYTDVSPTSSASKLTGASAIEFVSGASVLLSGAARSNAGVHYRYSCVAPIVLTGKPFDTIKYWAVVDHGSCCGTSSSDPDYTACPGWNSGWTKSIVDLEPSASVLAAAELSVTTNAYTGANTQEYVYLVESITDTQTERLRIVLACYVVPALIAILWLPIFILFHHCGCCRSCEQRAASPAASSSAPAAGEVKSS